MLGIVGYGPVGRKTAKLFDTINVADRSKDLHLDLATDIVFICVPEEDLDAAIEEYKGLHIIIRTTIAPCNAYKYKDYTLWPEFDVTETQNKGSDLTVITEDTWLLNELTNRLPTSTKIHIVNHEEACLIKLFDVDMLTTIVNQCKLYNSICNDYNIHWTNIRNILLDDTRFPRSHSQFINGSLSKCCMLAKHNLEIETNK